MTGFLEKPLTTYPGPWRDEFNFARQRSAATGRRDLVNLANFNGAIPVFVLYILFSY